MDRLERQSTRAFTEDGLAPVTSFPKIEGILAYCSYYQEALGLVADRKAMLGYRFTIDYLFSEVCPEYREIHAAFLQDGVPLSERIGAEELRRCEHAMFCLLAMCIALRDDATIGEAPRFRWADLVENARQHAALTYRERPAAVMH
jgi:hypothetical protein